jgi:hypothetical protein
MTDNGLHKRDIGNTPGGPDDTYKARLQDSNKKIKVLSSSDLTPSPQTYSLAEWVNWSTYSLPPTTKTFTLAAYANFHKFTMIFYIVGLMWYYGNYSLGCCVYAALHGSYGFLWNLKTMAFPDKGHQQRMSIGSLPPLFVVLFGYWYIAWRMVSGKSEQNPSLERIFWSVLVYVMGVSFMMITDAQKYFCLLHKKGLIDYGMFASNRNPNYLGEMMLYGSFAIISNCTIAWVILLSVWCTIFTLMMYIKELSYRRKEGWEKYKAASYVVLFKVYGSHFLSFIFYGCGLALGIYFYNHGGMFAVFKKIAFKH